MEACKYCNACGSDDEYGTAMSETLSSLDASPSNVSTASNPRHQNHGSAVEVEIEASRVHWSELSTELSVEAEQKQREQIVNGNREVFQNLVEKTKVSGVKQFSLNFLRNDDLLLGEKIAEGGQAEIYLAECREENSSQMRKVVMKVFKLEGAPLLHLQHQLPQGFIKNPDHCSCIYCANLLDDGRFAFQMKRYWGDLRKLIDLRMRDNHHQGPPFTISKSIHIMQEIAQGMVELRRRNVIHRDLKASNVLVHPYLDAKLQCPRHGGEFYSLVADYECSLGVVGTRFWRAPEILSAVKDIRNKPELFSEKADVYSYSMTCYEVLSGKIPFDDVPSHDYEQVFSGRTQLEWPGYIEPQLKALLERCSDLQPSRRPSFEEIYDAMSQFLEKKKNLKRKLDSLCSGPLV